MNLEYHDTDIPELPGRIAIPILIEGPDFEIYWRKVATEQEEGVDEDVYPTTRAYLLRCHFVKAIELEGELGKNIKLKDIQAGKLTYQVLMNRIVEITDKPLRQAVRLPNLGKRSTPTENESPKPETTSEK